jgi:hypothetical protein
MSTTEERFWAKVNKDGPTQPHMETPCWVWTAHKQDRGYGTIQVDGKCRKASRVAIQLSGRLIAADECACHHCDNPSCVRPDHLFVGSRADNSRDMRLKGRQGPRPNKGSGVGTAKLNESDVVLIRQLRASGVSGGALSRRFGVSIRAVRMVVQRLTWCHVA